MTSKTHAVLHAARRAAHCAALCRVSEIGCEFCCTSKTHVIAADGLLHIQTAHPKRKFGCAASLTENYDAILNKLDAPCSANFLGIFLYKVL
jgi:hypothetical protein